jgi:biotin transport system substrate-specific component
MAAFSPLAVIRPANPRLTIAFDAALIAGFSLLIALGAQVAIPLPFTPVPVTLQTLAVLMAGCLLGSSRGALAVLAYLAEGFAGLPVFSAGRSGVAHLFGPTGGYLLGFVAAAFVAGLLTERGAARSWIGSLAAMGAGNLAVYVPGILWLSVWTGPEQALALGLAPYLAGDALKCICGASALAGISLIRWKAKTRRG